jgi:hypothetical protein
MTFKKFFQDVHKRGKGGPSFIDWDDAIALGSRFPAKYALHLLA